MSICPVCQSEISRSNEIINCPSCNTIHHKDCWSFNRGCGVFECQRNPSTQINKQTNPSIVRGKQDQKLFRSTTERNPIVVPTILLLSVALVLCLGSGILFRGYFLNRTVVSSPLLSNSITLPTFDKNSIDHPWLETKALESYSNDTLESVGTHTYTIESITRIDTLLWNYGWCTSTPEILDENWQSISLKFIYDEVEVPLDRFGHVDDIRHFENIGRDLNCRSYFAALTDWPTGDHILQTIITFTRSINDGIKDYPSGTRIFEYSININQ